MCLHTSQPSSPKPTDRLNHTNKDKLWICMLVSARPCGYRSLFQSALHQVRSERYPLSSRAKESFSSAQQHLNRDSLFPDDFIRLVSKLVKWMDTYINQIVPSLGI